MCVLVWSGHVWTEARRSQATMHSSLSTASASSRSSKTRPTFLMQVFQTAVVFLAPCWTAAVNSTPPPPNTMISGLWVTTRAGLAGTRDPSTGYIRRYYLLLNGHPAAQPPPPYTQQFPAPPCLKPTTSTN
ncbi:hypothetical protein Pcinc_018247 [Petrolisthes cinctipes]|uniref:Uncharacterized protein n=1 Tax=Petrolisthes cinctipes TaxID=88211 RepID=A0AAE1FNJ0_PETCI|nr:hypothetical protein Pcinc_018247 [Petrolisthes cinctipes]